MSRITTFIIILLILILSLGGVWYWFYFEKGLPPNQNTVIPTSTDGFTPLNPNSTVPKPTTPQPATTTKTDLPKTTDSTPLSKIKQIYNTPVAFGIMASSSASTTSVFFVDRGTGHLYQGFIDSGTTTKISDTTILRVYESYFDQKGNNMVLRYIKEGTETVTSLYAPVATDIKAKYLSANITDVTFSPKGDKMFTLEKNGTGVLGYVSKIDGSNKTKVFDSPLHGWKLSWPEENTVTLTTKASRLSPGYLFFLDVKKGSLKKILGPLYGLTTQTNYDLKKVLYSQSLAGKIETKLYSVADGASQDTLFLTLPEKCVWSKIKKTSVYCAVPSEPQENLPDAWYKGLVHTTDQIWHLDTVTGEIYKVANLFESTGTSLDVTNLVLDSKEQALFFINSNDLSLWGIDLND